MSGTQPSSFAPANALYNPMMALNQTEAEQRIGANEAEMIARVSQGLLDPKLYPDEASRAAAWGPAVRQLRDIGFAQKAPDVYPGEATLRRAALLGTSSTKQAEWNYNTGVNQVGLDPSPAAPAATTPGTGTAVSSQPVTPSGTATIGQRQNNPGNLMFAGQPGAQPGQGNRFAAFPDMPTGVAANAAQLALYQTQHGINTVRGAVTRWVSDPKADLTSYVGDIAKALGVGPDDPIDLTNPDVQAKFIQAQFPHESAGGGYVLNPADVQRGVQMAAQQRGQPVQQRPGGGGGGTTTTAAATPPGATTPPAASTAPPASPFGAGAFASPTRTVAAAPATTANAPNVPTNLVPPVNTPQMVAAQAQAARTGKPAPIEGSDGLFALPGGGVSSGATAGGLGRRAAADAVIEGQQTAATTLPPQSSVQAAGPAAGGGGTPVASQQAPVSAFGGGAFATPPPNMLAPGASGGGPAAAAVQPAPQNVVAPGAPGAPAPAPAAPAPAPSAPPAPPRLPQLVDNLTADDRRQLAGMVRDDPARFTAAKTAMQARNIALQERALADYDRAQTAARAQQQFAETQRQHQIENERAAAAAARQEEEAARKRAEAADPIQGTGDKANADRLLLSYVDKILDGSATAADRRLYAEAAQYYLKPQMQWIDDPSDPTKKQMAPAPGQLPEGFPHPSFKPGEQPEQKPAVTTKTDFKPLPETERKQLIDTATRIDQETQQRNTFKPEYAGFGNAAIGEFANAVARNNPIASKTDTARAEWWQNYQRYKLAVRQGVSGQSLTASELGEFDKADIHPGMTPQAVRDNLLQQDKILRTAHERRVGSLSADRYSPEAIRAASGVDPAKVTARPLTDTATPKPDTAPHPPGFQVLIP